MALNRIDVMKNIKRVVIKVGTSSLTHKTGLLNIKSLENIVRQITDLHNRGIEMVLVTSGAIGAGVGKLGLNRKPDTIPEKQAAAAIGQCVLLHMYEKLFSEYGITVAQILLTKEDMVNKLRYQNARNTFFSLFELGVIPIVNENDAIIVDEIKFGDNDTLSAVVSRLIDADLLIILSDIDGLYDSNPKLNKAAKLVSYVKKITKQIEDSAGDTASNLGTGGMVTKISAAKIAVSGGSHMVIANSSNSNILSDIYEGKDVGTFFEAKKRL
jgi:glutamate 5-kinase